MNVPESASSAPSSGPSTFISLLLPVVLFLLLIGNPYNSAAVALAAAGAAIVLLLIAFVQRRFRAAAGSLVIAAGAAALFVWFGKDRPAEDVRERPASKSVKAARAKAAATAPAPASPDQYVKTAFYNLHLTEYRNKMRGTKVLGGAFARIGRSALVATGDGRFFAIEREPKTDALSIRQVPGTALPRNGFASPTSSRRSRAERYACLRRTTTGRPIRNAWCCACPRWMATVNYSRPTSAA
jgi:hypothetical protein